jgi:hypothetical protein
MLFILVDEHAYGVICARICVVYEPSKIMNQCSLYCSDISEVPEKILVKSAKKL